MKKVVIYTDLDGTLLDAETYSFKEAVPALSLVREKGIPLVFCSSKSGKEIEYYREKAVNCHPFVSENGGGIFVPRGYFDGDRFGPELRRGSRDGYDFIRLGARYEDLRNALKELKKRGFEVKGFGDMSVEEIARLTGLEPSEAALSREREFDEPFIFDGSKEDICAAITGMGFMCTRGRFFHILGDSDKGRAVSILTDAYKKEYGDVFTIALGDNMNDLPMLEAADRAVLVRKPDGAHTAGIEVPGLIKADGVGPAGWNSEVLRILKELGAS